AGDETEQLTRMLLNNKAFQLPEALLELGRETD
ncbi:MAG: hypothetical protein K0Q63_3732, partial [Paenibacillus sp.]|nr:hypothetical protein [Paenibacillus sp.]